MLLLLLPLSRFSRVQLCATPYTAAHQAPLSLGFSRQEHWSGLPFPSPMCASEVAQSCPTHSDPMDCSPPGSSIHGIFLRVLEWGAIAFSGRYYYYPIIRRGNRLTLLADNRGWSCLLSPGSLCQEPLSFKCTLLYCPNHYHHLH